MSKVIFTYEMESNEKDNKEDIIANLIGALQTLLDANQYQCKECRDLEVTHYVEIKQEVDHEN